MQKTKRFIGTYAQVLSKRDEWIALNPGAQILHEGAPVTRGAMNLDTPTWELSLDYEDEPELAG